MKKDFWVITSFFNPARFKSLLNNYFVFADRLKKQGVNLLTIELAFFNSVHQIPKNENVLQLRGKSVMWQKERLLNYGISQLPSDCKYYAWIDCDVLFSEDNWADIAVEKLQNADIIQVFKKIYLLPKGHLNFTGERILAQQGIVWQRKIHKNWLERRCKKDLPFAVPGFGWACHRNTFDHTEGIYDRNIVGSGDTFMVDCYFDSWDIHGFAPKFNQYMRDDMMAWCEKFRQKKMIYDYLPFDVCHLYHGELKNRQYMDRHEFILKNNYDPKTDIKLIDNVYEWSSSKWMLHNAVEQYFYDRQEDV